MTSEELEKACEDKTWLVHHDTLLQVVSRDRIVEPAWRVIISGGGNYWTYKEHLRLATARDLLELTDD